VARDLVVGAHVENRVGIERRHHAVRAVDREWLGLAQVDEAGDVVDVRIGDDDGLDRRIAQRAVLVGMEFRRLVDLLAQIGRGVEQHPVLAVGADGEGRLCARAIALRAGADGRRMDAVAVPLRETAARGRAENFDEHGYDAGFGARRQTSICAFQRVI